MSDLTGIFQPVDGDKFATATMLDEYMTVKPSGYVQHRGIFPPEARDMVLAGIRQYYAEQNRAEPVIFTRHVGALTWVAVEYVAPVIPDSLPVTDAE